jgi:predicted nucleic acid-binding protein
VPVGEEVARAAGSLAQRHRSNSGIDDADYLIAATALLLEVDLLTTNVRHFPMIAELEPAY